MLALLACACPDLSETEVVDHTSGSPDAMDAAKAALADFVAWTGREGVCLSTIAVTDTVEAQGEDVAGRFDAAYGAEGGDTFTPATIRVAAGDDAYDVTLHELCHALDAVEGHSAAHPDVFVEKQLAHNPLYPTPLSRAAEAFADACEQGPQDIGVGRLVEAECGREFYAADLRYINEVIHVNGERAPLTTGPLPTWTEVGAVTVPKAAYVGSWASVGGRLVGAGDDYDRAAQGTYPVLFVWDDASGSPDAEIDLRPWSPITYDPLLLSAEERAVLALETSWRSAPVRMLELDPASRVITELPGQYPSMVDEGAVVGDTLFLSAMRDDSTGHLLALDTAGVPLPLDEAGWFRPQALDTAAWIVDGDRVIRFNAIGEPTARRRPGHAWPYSSDGVTLDLGLVSGRHGELQVGLDDDTVIVPEDVCAAAAPPMEQLYWNGRLAAVTPVPAEDFRHYVLWTLTP